MMWWKLNVSVFQWEMRPLKKAFSRFKDCFCFAYEVVYVLRLYCIVSAAIATVSPDNNVDIEEFWKTFIDNIFKILTFYSICAWLEWY